MQCLTYPEATEDLAGRGVPWTGKRVGTAPAVYLGPVLEVCVSLPM